MNNNGRDQLVIQKIFIKPDNSMSPEEWIYNATHFPKIPALRVANMAEMYDMIRNGDPFLSNESVDIAYMSSSRCGCSYYTWFPTNYKWEYFSSVHWGNTFLEHQLALRCLIDFPIL